MCFSTFNLIQHGNLNNSQWCNWYMSRLFVSISVSYKCTLAKFHTWYLIVMVLQQLSLCHTIITRKKCSVAISLGNKVTELKWLTVTSVLSNWDIVLTASKWEKKFDIWVKWVFSFTCESLLISFFKLIPVKSFTHLRNYLSADVCGKSVCLWRVREVADPSS